MRKHVIQSQVIIYKGASGCKREKKCRQLAVYAPQEELRFVGHIPGHILKKSHGHYLKAHLMLIDYLHVQIIHLHQDLFIKLIDDLHFDPGEAFGFLEFPSQVVSRRTAQFVQIFLEIFKRDLHLGVWQAIHLEKTAIGEGIEVVRIAIWKVFERDQLRLFMPGYLFHLFEDGAYYILAVTGHAYASLPHRYSASQRFDAEKTGKAFFDEIENAARRAAHACIKGIFQ